MSGRTDNGSRHAAALADLAGRLTSRDRELARLLAEHQVLTTEQCQALLGASPVTLGHRLVELARLQVVDRFRPLTQVGAGSAPYHYVVGQAGAAVLAAEQGIDPAALGYQRDQALAVAHNGRLLAHLVGVNGFFAALAQQARRRPGARLVCFWPAARCAERWGTIVRPDAYGRWADPADEVDFFLEHDPGDTPPEQLAGKLAGYDDLALGSGIATPVLVWVATPEREAALRRLPPPAPVPVATGVQTLGSPADQVWLPLGRAGPRHTLAALAHADAW
jgi:Replication-relaxation